MALEAASFLDDLVDTNPPGGDRLKQADDHLRLLKTVLKATFPGLTRAIYLEKARADLASAATPNLGGTTTNYVNIIGTTEIDGFTGGVAGMSKLVRFAGILVLDHDDTNFPLITSANITTAAGDHALFYAVSAAEWHMIGYWRKNGEPLASSVPDATEDVEGAVELATDEEIWAAAAGNKALTAEDLGGDTTAFQAVADGAPVAIDWEEFQNGVVTVTASRMIGNPTNGIPGTHRKLLVIGNDATDRVITFDDEFLGEIPIITDCDSTRWYMLYMECITSTHFAVSSKRVFG